MDGRTWLRSYRWTVALVSALASALAFAQPAEDFEQLFGRFLKEYWQPQVTIHGIRTTVFDYARMKQDASRPDSLFAQTSGALERADPARLGDEAAAKAFWINAYNFGAMRLVIEHYPVDSIRSPRISLFKYPWSKPVVSIHGKGYSLNDIEKDILLPRYGDPRIVFAVSCAAVSCPDRTPEAFSGARLDRQLDDMIRAFFANTDKGLRLDRDQRVLTLAWILKKDGHLFKGKEGDVVGFVLPYLPEEQREWLKRNAVETRYFDHDWALNDLALADRK